MERRSKRERILAGMLETVGELGYEGTSVRTVLDRTDLYRQAFYDHFASKEDCYLQAYEAGVGRIETGVRAAAAGAAGWTGQLRAGLGAFLDFLDSEADVGRALIVEVHPAGGEVLAMRSAALERAQDFVDGGRAAAATAAAAIAPQAIVAGIHSVVHSRLAAGESDGFRALLGELMYVAVLPYFGPETALSEMRV